MATFAVGDEQPLVTDLEILQAHSQHLTPPQSAEQHGLGHGPVPVGPEGRHEQFHFGGIENTRQPPHSSNERDTTLVTMTTPPSGHPPGRRVGDHPGVASDHQVAEQTRHR